MTRHLPSSSLLLLGTSLLLLCATVVPTLPAAAQAFSFGDPSATASTSDSYNSGTRALDQQRWQDAISDFDRVAAAKGKQADAALYWKAYALNKLGRSNLVSATCNQLATTYPRSSWKHDCSTLLAAAADPGIYVATPHGECIGCIHPGPVPNDNGIVRGGNESKTVHPAPQPNDDGIYVGGRPHAENEASHTHDAPGHSGEGTGSDADLKMLALNSLMQRNPAQALPVIRNILTGNSSPQLKQRALTAIGMSQSPDAQALLRDVATGKVAPTEQRQAVQMLGVFQGKRAADTLVEVYRNSPDRSIKRAALSGLFISGDAQHMVDLARNEKDLQLKHDIVAQLALMHDKAATDYMLELLK